MDEIIKPWANRRAGVVYVIDLSGRDLFFRHDHGWVTELCLGERYAHDDFGLAFEHECYRGSYIDNWHGGPTGSLTDMVRWVSEAEHPEYGLGYALWMKTNRVPIRSMW